ncbi:MAG: thermonuclease family protein, partial [Phycisphaerae bacterium]
GDTIDLDIYDPLRRKAHTRVRLWGVDTPEKGWNGRPAMYYGEQATTFVAQHVLGKTVRIELHPRKRTRDKYDRLLAYVWLPETGQMLNELLVETGHAYADLRFDHLYKARFVRLERTARKQKRGLWAAVRPEQWPAWRRRMVRASGPKSRPAPASHARPR